MFYKSAIDTGPYVEFLRNAISTKKEMKIVSQDRADIGTARLIGSSIIIWSKKLVDIKR